MQRISRTLALFALAVSWGCEDVERVTVDTRHVTAVSAGPVERLFEVPVEDAGAERPVPAGVPPERADGRDRVLEVPKPTRYPSGVVHSPLTAQVVENLRTIADLDLTRRDDVFAKIGASSLDSSRTLACFAGEHVDRELMSAVARDALELFLGGDAGGGDPFSRDAISAVAGKTAAWVIGGSPSPLDQELDLTQARFGLIEYGTNDMHMGATYASALWGFGDALITLTDTLIAQGIIPMLHTNRARLDSVSADRWVGTYNAVIRGVAQGRQVPFLDQFVLLEELPDFGLGTDGLHMSTYTEGGSARTCRFHDAAMQYGYNTRNLATVEALARMTAVVTDGLDAPDTGEVMSGEGTTDSPFVIEALPFSAMRNTLDSHQADLDVYTGCDAEQDESGAEHVYRLQLEETTRLRALVIDQVDVDVDLHLLDETATVEGCLGRHDRLWEGTLGPGSYHFVLDTFVSAEEPKPGEYLFVLVACHPDDEACD